ncbi:MAG: hypothetical protein HY909_16655 [Deltaproteobacteria bacterium]|nr:hypothetical protein [Deltaproteobacteria bacterium]
MAARAIALGAALWSAEARAQDSVGLNTHVPGSDLLDECVDLGVRWIRVDGNWLDLNPASGRYTFATMDAVVDGARRRGLRVFMTLAYTPLWVPRVARARSDAYEGNDEPAGSAEWEAFVRAAVEHFRPRGVTHYGLWNEPNLSGFWESSADAWIDKIALPGQRAVRAACADCKVLGPDLAHVGSYETFLDRVLVRAPAWDILTHHIYNGWPETGTTIFSGDNFLQALETRRLPITRAALREVLDARRFTREVWITETGYRAAPGDPAAEARQAVYVRRVLEEQLPRAWWTNTFFYEVMDCGVDDPMCPIDGFGLARPTRPLSMGGERSFPRDYRLKPAYLAIRDFLRTHPAILSETPPDSGVSDASRVDAPVDALPDSAAPDTAPPDAASDLGPALPDMAPEAPPVDSAPEDRPRMELSVTDRPSLDAAEVLTPEDTSATDSARTDAQETPSPDTRGTTPLPSAGCGCHAAPPRMSSISWVFLALLGRRRGRGRRACAARAP